MATDASRVGWLYQARRVNSQTAGGGGNLKINLSLASGQLGIIKQMYVVGSASAGSQLDIDLLDEDGAVACHLATVAAGASRVVSFPALGGAATSNNNTAFMGGFMIGPGQTLSCATSVALNTETLTVAVAILLYNASTAPTWDTTGSGGTPSLAASTISAANTSQAVVVNPP